MQTILVFVHTAKNQRYNVYTELSLREREREIQPSNCAFTLLPKNFVVEHQSPQDFETGFGQTGHYKDD